MGGWPPFCGLRRRRALLAAAALTRTVGVLLLVPAAGYVVLRRLDIQRLAFMAVPAAVLLGGYAVLFHAEHGEYRLVAYEGYFLAGRVSPFAQCTAVDLPPEEQALCDERPPAARPGPDWYHFMPGSPLRLGHCRLRLPLPHADPRLAAPGRRHRCDAPRAAAAHVTPRQVPDAPEGAGGRLEDAGAPPEEETGVTEGHIEGHGVSADAEEPEGTAPDRPPWRQDAARLAVLFLATRITLTAIGLVSRELVPGRPFRPMPLGVGPAYSRFPFLDLWGAWDSSWYVSIAQVGYRPEPLYGPFANYAFFPLFPLLARTVGWLFDNVFIGGLVVANLALLVACLFLYRLVLLDHDVETARRSVKYLFAAPGAFFLSGMLSESLYLALVVMCFYFARTRRWWLVGVLGILLTLSRGPGVLAVLPLAWIYFDQRGFSLRRIRPDVLWLAGLPAGIGIFMWVNHEVTGDALAFAHIQMTAWDHRLQNPLTALWHELSVGDIFNRFNAWYIVGVLAASVAFLRKLGVAYGSFVLLSVVIPIAYGPSYSSMVRYSTVIFPLYIVLARFTRSRPGLDQVVTISAALLQGFLMSLWANSSFLIV